MYRRPELEIKWPNLSRTDYRVTSQKSQEYNCFAWAAGEEDRWWQPIPGEQFYWPEGVPQEETLDAYIQAYQTLRYEICNVDTLESGYQKIAIYVDSSGIPTHAARQLPNGKWTSKLGWLEDVEHELDGLTGDRYGVVGQILKRAINYGRAIIVAQKPGFFTKLLGCTNRLGKKPGFFVGVRPGLYLSVAKARQALISAEVSSEKSSRISASVMPPARYSKMS